jgi:competence protein ComEC
LAKEYGAALGADILKVAHHGSKYSESESFAKNVSPEYAVFQVGKNNFGHPNKGVIEKFRRKGIMIYRNDEDGAVAFDFGRNGSIKVKTVKGDKD